MKMKKQEEEEEETKREAGRTSGKIGKAPLVVETIEVDLGEVGVVSVVRIEAEVVVAAAAAAISEVAEEVSEVAEGVLGIVMVATISEEAEEVGSGVGVDEEEIGVDLERVLVKVAEEVSGVVIMLEDSRRGTRLVAVRTRKLSLRIDFEGKLKETLS
jgi:hypothetical protein